MKKLLQSNIFKGFSFAILLLIATNLLNFVSTSLLESSFQTKDLKDFTDKSIVSTFMCLLLTIPFIIMTFRLEAKKFIKYVLNIYAYSAAFLGLIVIPLHLAFYQTGSENLSSSTSTIALTLHHWPISLFFTINLIMTPWLAIFLTWTFLNQNTKFTEAINYYFPLAAILFVSGSVIKAGTPLLANLFTNELNQLVVFSIVSIASIFGALRISTNFNRNMSSDENLKAESVKNVRTPLAFISSIWFSIVPLLVMIYVPNTDIKFLGHVNDIKIELFGMIPAVLLALAFTSKLKLRGWISTLKEVTVWLFLTVGIFFWLTVDGSVKPESFLIYARAFNAGAIAMVVALVQIAIVALPLKSRLKTQSQIGLIIGPILAFVAIIVFGVTSKVFNNETIATLPLIIGGCWLYFDSIRIVARQTGLKERLEGSIR